MESKDYRAAFGTRPLSMSAAEFSQKMSQRAEVLTQILQTIGELTTEEIQEVQNTNTVALLSRLKMLAERFA